VRRLIFQKSNVKKINSVLENKINRANKYLESKGKTNPLFTENDLFGSLKDLKEEYYLLEILDFDVTKKNYLLDSCSILDMTKHIACLRLNRLSKIEKVK
jgi:hypothetical protein